MIPSSSDPPKTGDAPPLPREISGALRAIPWVTAVLLLVIGAAMFVFSLYNRTHVAAHDEDDAPTKPL